MLQYAVASSRWVRGGILRMPLRDARDGWQKPVEELYFWTRRLFWPSGAKIGKKSALDDL
jgi:hypothetical protein